MPAFKAVAVIDPRLVPAGFADEVGRLGVDFAIRDCATDGEKVEACRDADFVITGLRSYRFPRAVIERLDRCRFIRWIVGPHQRVLAGDPVPAAGPEASARMSVLRSSTLGLIGFGRTGRAMVPKARGFGMTMLAHDPYVDQADAAGYDVELVGLERLLEESDFVSVHAQLTPSARHLIGSAGLRRMKPTAFVVNVARGAILDEAALVQALSTGQIAGAGLDVTDPDPPPAESPLARLDNVVLTGHNAGASAESRDKMWTFPVEQIGRVLRGQPPLWMVNPDAALVVR